MNIQKNNYSNDTEQSIYFTTKIVIYTMGEKSLIVIKQTKKFFCNFKMIKH